MFARFLRCSLLLLVGLRCEAPDSGGKAEYVGGTLATLKQGDEGTIRTTDKVNFEYGTNQAMVRVPYERINLLEYGQNVSRRVLLAFAVHPMFLLSKKRAHFLTVGYQDDEGKQQALVFRVDKKHIRMLLASLEARTGLKVQFQDEEARKAGRG